MFSVFFLLRIACINFVELCKKKNNDGAWRDEIAAMQAFSHSGLPYLGTSGIILAGEDNDSSREFMINVQNGGLSSRKPNGTNEASASESTISPVSLDNNQGNVRNSCSCYLRSHVTCDC